MEIGAVKQAFNNELILLKKKLNQAKIQIINKLTRKAKTFLEKKCPEKLKEKLKRKAEAAIKEVLIIKKIKPKDLARFIVTHKAELNSYLNKPTVDNDKACARLLLHKSLQDKYKFLKGRFSSVPIEDLLMSREDRRKLKKEAKEKQNNKKKGKNDNKVINSQGDWEVEDVDMPIVKQNGNESSNDEDEIPEDVQLSDDSGAQLNEDAVSGDESDEENDDNSAVYESASEASDVTEENEDNGKEDNSNESDSEDDTVSNVGHFAKAVPEKNESILKPLSAKLDLKIAVKGNKNLEKKVKDKHKLAKNKNLKEKMLSRNFKKEVTESLAQETKMVDPFFITSTGENYMSVVEPRQPDEVKEVHKQGNRKIRRAAMFGHVPNIKPQRDHVGQNNRFNRNNDNYSSNDSFQKFNSSKVSSDRNFTERRNNYNNRNEEKVEKPEKLHPSWEAKKKQSGILPFQGKKIVFDES